MTTEFPTWEELKQDPVGKVYVLRVGDGIAWMVRRGTMSLCAYVGFPPDSPFYGHGSEWADEIAEVHGGFTFPNWSMAYKQAWMEATGAFNTDGDVYGWAERAEAFKAENPEEWEGRVAQWEGPTTPEELKPYKDWWWYGWDYGHAWDAPLWVNNTGLELPALERSEREDRRWTLEMVIPEAEEAARAFSKAVREAMLKGEVSG
jgi:hypothetical protein